MYMIKLKIRCCHLMLNSPFHEVAGREFHLLLSNEANIERTMLDCWALLSRAIVQLSSANTAQTIRELFAWYWG